MRQNTSHFNLLKLSPSGNDNTRCPIAPLWHGCRAAAQSRWVQVHDESEQRSCSRVVGPRRKREAHAVDHWSLGTDEGIGIWESLVRALRWTVVLTLYFHVIGGSVRLDGSWARNERSGGK